MIKMHISVLIIVLFFSLYRFDCRPSPQSEESESANKDVEYQGDNDAVAEDYAPDEQEYLKNEAQQMADDREEVPRYAHQPQQIKDDNYLKADEERRTAHARLEANKFSDYKTGRDIGEESDQNTNLDDNVAIPTNGQHINIYRETYEADSNNQPVTILPSAAHNPYNAQDRGEDDHDHNEMNYQPVAKEEGEMLFKNRRSHKETDTYRFNHEPLFVDGQKKPNREYYNAIQMNNKRVREEKRYDNNPNIERDRRQVQKSLENINDAPNEKESSMAGSVEDNETAIKNKIKKLSKDELEDLLNSLSEDKQTILKKVIDDKELPNKREITKKAGAIEENNFNENSPVDMRNSQGGCASESDVDLTVAQNSDVTVPSIPNESNDMSSTKTSDYEKNSEKPNSSAELTDNNLKSAIDSRITNIDGKNEDNLNDNTKDSAKNENKRETNFKQLSNDDKINFGDEKLGAEYEDSLVEQSAFCGNNKDYADLTNGELLSDVKTVNKRETDQDISFESAESLKCLQDSFPTENEKSNLKSDLVPLIRVKRTDTDHLDKKRDTNIMANIKVPFFPDAENENLENDERSEFEDYGIFDRKTHFTRSEQFVDSDKSKIEASCHRQQNFKSNDGHSSEEISKVQNIKSEMDNMNLGSDTDSVLTGADGVDENIMFNSGLRNKRAVENSKVITENTNFTRFGRTIEPLEMNRVLEDTANIQEYKENGNVEGLTRQRIRDAKENVGCKD